jgi:transposase
MFIRQTRTANKATGEAYFTYRLVRGERIGGKVRQITVANLGRQFSVPQSEWPLLCARIEQLLLRQDVLVPIDCPAALERVAQRYAAQLISRAPAGADAPPAASAADGDAAATPSIGLTFTPAPASDVQSLDLNSLQQSRPRSVGVEHVALHAISELGLLDKLTELGLNGVTRASILGNLIARMAAPASERASWNWLTGHSALGELLDVDFEGLSHMRLYRASDALMRHREAIEAHVFGAAQSLFGFDETVTLYDLTNTYFEGDAASASASASGETHPANPKAKHGRSKEKRSDCPLVTLGLVLDGSGFVRRSKTFAGNVSEGGTLAEMLNGLGATPGALVVMDAGVATEANVAWLAAHGWRYLVVRRGGSRQFDTTEASTSVNVETASGATVRLQKQASEDGKEVRLYCHSEGREAKETAMSARFCERFEAGLNKMAEGLGKPRGEKDVQKLLMRIGRLKEKSRGVSQHYTVNLTPDAEGKKALSLSFEKTLVSGTMATHPGVYCLRSNELDWSEARLWQTYTMLTDLESVFKSLKSELGLRPVFHSKELRVDGHLFITVLAYQCVQVLRTKLKAAGINESWTGLRQTLSRQQRVTASMRRVDGCTVHVRKATLAEPDALAIYKALGIDPAPGGTRKLIN